MIHRVSLSFIPNSRAHMEVKPSIETFAKIKVVGVGGSGGSAVNRMVAGKIRGVEFLAANTDVQALHHSQAATKIQIGKSVTKGLGAGMDPQMGQKSAEENQNEIRDSLADSDMVFITCGLGGGTGTGAAPVVADLAKDVGALTIAVVTKPFSFEGSARRMIAEKGWDELASKVDAIITIPNDKVLQIVDKKTSIMEAFEIVDEVLQQGVRGISELITVPGLVNVDFADVKAIMKGAGSALMGIGVASGDNRAVEAAKLAISSPLLELSIEGAKGVLFTITGGPDLAMLEINEAAKIITSATDPDAKVIFGAVIDENIGDEIRITVIATGFSEREKVVSKAPFEKSFGERQPFNSSSSIFGQPVTRSVGIKSPVKDLPVQTRGFEEDAEEQNGDEIDVPAFIRKKMS